MKTHRLFNELESRPTAARNTRHFDLVRGFVNEDTGLLEATPPDNFSSEISYPALGMALACSSDLCRLLLTPEERAQFDVIMRSALLKYNELAAGTSTVMKLTIAGQVQYLENNVL